MARNDGGSRASSAWAIAGPSGDEDATEDARTDTNQ